MKYTFEYEYQYLAPGWHRAGVTFDTHSKALSQAIKWLRICECNDAPVAIRIIKL